MKKLLFTLTAAVLLLTTANPQGKVYLIFGSDTGIWETMSTSSYHDYYNINLISNPSENFYKTMDPAYRSKFSDSYGGKLKITWWIMGGNLIRYARNKNVPNPNSLVPYAIKKNYSDKIAAFGDELSLHYHTFFWSDYDNDGIYYWNQAKNFLESKEDFDFTVAQFLLDENIFPVSFRTGWNTMDNEWQNDLDNFLPFSMHNEAPAFNKDTVEPFDNNYDWRKASKEFVPYHPSSLDYQLPGNLKGYNLHSVYNGSVTQAKLNLVFQKAAAGTDQVMCIWGHVWDDVWLTNMLKIDSLAKISAQLYPTAKYKYCTAVEGMQLWKKTNDYNAPQISITEIPDGNKIKIQIETDEAIFQPNPILAVKNLKEYYSIEPMVKLSNTKWITANSYNKKSIAKYGVAVTDTSGNHSIKTVNIIPDDIFIDNSSSDYSEINGTWTTDPNNAWGVDSRKSILASNDSSKARWNLTLPDTGYCNLYVQIPKANNRTVKTKFRIYSNNSLASEVQFSDTLTSADWVYLSTIKFNTLNNNYIEVVALGNENNGKTLYSDVIKISYLVNEKNISVFPEFADYGSIPVYDTLKTNIKLSNRGTGSLHISGIQSSSGLFSAVNSFPIAIGGMSTDNLKIRFTTDQIGIYKDTLKIFSDDEITPVTKIPVKIIVEKYFVIVDNDNPSVYQEYGTWNFSVAQAWGGTSRYAPLNQNPGARAVFKANLQINDRYNVFHIVPVTVNASNKALYIIKQGTGILDSLYIDQNYNSGKWTYLGNYQFNNTQPVEISIIDNGKNTLSGAVLRADAFKLAVGEAPLYVQDELTIPKACSLEQNYPNPFNPATVISFSLPEKSKILLSVYNLLGEKVALLGDEVLNTGYYTKSFNASGLASGIYFYKLEVISESGKNNFSSVKKMLLLK